MSVNAIERRLAARAKRQGPYRGLFVGKDDGGPSLVYRASVWRNFTKLPILQMQT